MDVNNMQYWQKRYLENATGWDLGEASPPLKAYFDQLVDRSMKILIPGAGNAHEAEYLHKRGFENVHVVDWAPKAIENIQERIPSFPSEHLHAQNFFDLDGQFDLVVEQTFFCALMPHLRAEYVQKMHSLLKPNAKLMGLLFQVPLNDNQPPFGGNAEEYQNLFSDLFQIHYMETAYNSIAPRSGNELFILLQKK